MQALGNLLLKSIALFCGHHISINYSANIMQFTLMTGVKRTRIIKFSPLLLPRAGVRVKIRDGRSKQVPVSLFRISRTRHVCHTRTQTLKHGPYFKSSKKKLGELEGTYSFFKSTWKKLGRDGGKAVFSFKRHTHTQNRSLSTKST